MPRVNFNLDKATFKELKLNCVKDEVSMTQMFYLWINAYLRKKRQQDEKEKER